MKRLSIDAEFYHQQVKRVTGKTVEQWDTDKLVRRIDGFRTRRLNGSQLFDAYERDECIRFNGLSEHDFETVVGVLDPFASLNLPMAWDGLPQVQVSSEKARRIVAHHQARSNSGKPQPNAVACILYRLGQGALRRIAEESRPSAA